LLRFVINITSNIVSSLARLCYCIISASTVDGYYILCYGQCQKQRHNWLAHLAMYKSARVNEARSALESCSVMGTTAIPRYYRGNGDGLSGVPSLLTDLSSCMASCLAEQTALNCCWTVQWLFDVLCFVLCLPMNTTYWRFEIDLWQRLYFLQAYQGRGEDGDSNHRDGDGDLEQLSNCHTIWTTTPEPVQATSMGFTLHDELTITQQQKRCTFYMIPPSKAFQSHLMWFWTYTGLKSLSTLWRLLFAIWVVGTGIKHPVPDRHLYFLTSGHSDAQPWASECPDVKKLQITD